MPFIRLSDNYIDHPKFLALSDGAFRLWHEGMAFCRKHQTDGVIPASALSGFRYHRPARVTELVAPYKPGAASLWDRVDGVGFKVHDYLDWNRSRAEDEQLKTEANERTKKWRKKQSGDATRDASQDAHVLDRIGSGSNSSEGIQGKPPARNGAGVLSGALPRDHASHYLCDPTFSRCVPASVHAKLKSLLAPKFAGDREQAQSALETWYPTVWLTLPADFVMGEAFRFWQGRFDAAFASADAVGSSNSFKKPEPKSNVPSADETRRRYLS